MALRRWSLLALAAACGAVAQTVACWGTEVWSFALACAIFAVGGWSLSRLSGPAAAVPVVVTTPQPRWSLVALALVFAALASSYVGEPLSGLQLGAYSLSVACLVASTVGPAQPAGSQSQSSQGSRVPSGRLRRPYRAAILIAVTALALGLRLYRLDTLPAVIWDDEILYLHDAIVFFAEQGFPSPFASGTWGAPYLHAYSIAAVAAWVDDRALALRLVSAVPGALAVPLLYLAMRELFDRSFALVAPLLLALSAWALILSRNGYVWAINGFVEAGALWALARGLRRGTLRDFAIAGLFLAAGVVYSYAATFMPIAIALFALAQVVVDPKAMWARRTGWAILVLAAVVGAAPRLSTMLANADMRGYQRQALVQGNEEDSMLAVVGLQLGQIAASFNRRADANPFYVPAAKEPLLDPITAASFGLGLAWALFSWRRPGAQLLVLTFAVMLVPPAIGLSSTEWATAWRASGVLPALFGLAAAPFAIAAAMPATPSSRGVVAVLLGLVLALAAFINLHTYFVRHAAKPGWNRGPRAQRMRVAERLLRTSPDERVLLSADVESDYTRALVRGRRTYEVFAWPDDDDLPPLLGIEVAHTLVLVGTEAYWEDDLGTGEILSTLLRHYYPGGEGERVVGPGGEPMLEGYRLDRAAIAAAHGLAWVAAADGGAEASATLDAPRDAAYELSVDDGAAQIEVDGQAFSGGFLARGLHDLRVRRSGGAATLRWSIEGGPLDAVPDSALLRRPLPAWGFIERGPLEGAGAAWQRWVPVLWHAAPERAFGALGAGGVEWSGEVELPAGAYTLLLRASAAVSAQLGDTRIAVDEIAWPGWLRTPVDIAAGWQPLRVRAGAAVAQRDLQLFWVDAGMRPGLFGGANSRWARRAPVVLPACPPP